jgi:hypothetical protein
VLLAEAVFLLLDEVPRRDVVPGVRVPGRALGFGQVVVLDEVVG